MLSPPVAALLYLFTSDFMDKVAWATWRQVGGVAVSCHAQTNAPAALYWLRRVMDDNGRRDQTSPSYMGCWGRSM